MHIFEIKVSNGFVRKVVRIVSIQPLVGINVRNINEGTGELLMSRMTSHNLAHTGHSRMILSLEMGFLKTEV